MTFTNTKVELTVLRDGSPFEAYTDMECPKHATVTFDVELECRDYGIKEIDVFPRGTVPIQFTTTTFDGDNENVVDRSVSVDVRLCKAEFTSGKHGQCFVDSLTVYLKPDWTVNYDKSVVGIVR